MRRTVRLALPLLLLTVPAAGDAQLIDQTTRGASRICIYQGARTGSIQRRQPQQYRVGLGEPCPRTPPEPQAEYRHIPAMARLRAHELQGGRRRCIYTDHVRDYVRSIPASLTCPLTPHF